MKILLTGSTGYIGRRILPVLLQDGHEVVCLVRDPRRFDYEDFSEQLLQLIEVVKGDLLDEASLQEVPKDIDVAYYLVHNMSSKYGDFHEMEQRSAGNFARLIDKTQAQQIIYLSGISNDEELSVHLKSRLAVEGVLADSRVPVTVLRAAIIIGSGSASFEILRDLVEKLPVMVAPRWIESRCQPISIRNVVQYLTGVMLREETYGQTFDVGGPEVLTYRQMLMGFARVRELQRFIFTVPVMTPRLSSYWLYFVTSTSYSLARNLVDSMHNEVVCKENRIREIVPIELSSYREALERAFQRIAQSAVISSWKDAIAGPVRKDFLDFVQVPEYGCLTAVREFTFEREPQEVIENIWSIGGERGWYYGNWLWKIRGLMDKIAGGVGLRRGRRDASDLKSGDALDFWRVLVADKEKKRLLLYAEMKLPGEAWLEFRIRKHGENAFKLIQKATFRPKGVWGRVYWYTVLPFHGLIFPGMAKGIIRYMTLSQRHPTPVPGEKKAIAK